MFRATRCTIGSGRMHRARVTATFADCQRSSAQNGFSAFAHVAWRLEPVRSLTHFGLKNRVVHLAWTSMREEWRRKFTRAAENLRPGSSAPKRPGRPRLGPWRIFVKKNYHRVQRLPLSKRLAALSRRYHAEKLQKK